MAERQSSAPIVGLKIPIEASDPFSKNIIVFDLNPDYLSMYVIEPNK